MRVGDRPPSVLLEVPDEARACALWGVLADAGCEVSWCPGPSAEAPSWCPMLGGRRCCLVESADLVLFGLDLDDDDGRRVLSGLRALHHDATIVVEADADQVQRRADALAGCRVLSRRQVVRSLPDLACTVAVAGRAPAPGAGSG